jgi:hypothetical protein
VVEALKLGKEPNVIQIEIIKRGIKEMLKGNFSFYKDTMDRLYGKTKERIEVEGEVKTENNNNLFNSLTETDEETRQQFIQAAKRVIDNKRK